jgi:hypothetical protein
MLHQPPATSRTVPVKLFDVDARRVNFSAGFFQV